LDIASEKAGIIKHYIPVVVGEGMNPELREFFRKKAMENSSILSFASESEMLANAIMLPDYSWNFFVKEHGLIHGELRGMFQKSNAITVLEALKVMSGLGIKTKKNALHTGFGKVIELTGLMGRWEEISTDPKVICDIGHNEDAWTVNSGMLENVAREHGKLHIVVGFSEDKEVDNIIKYFPEKAIYYFVNASSPRAMPAAQLAEKCRSFGIYGSIFKTVKEAVNKSISNASKNDMIFIGGSVFVVGEAYPLFSKTTN
jgi:dihydrofolate synthase/folylpolyglutamate synthase